MRPGALVSIWLGATVRAARSIAGAAPFRPSRLIAIAIVLPAFTILQALHWLGFLLDEILFPAYRRVRVDDPLFVVGMPRSGTTFLHATLAEDEGFATPALWELLFAPSITQRRLFGTLGRLDRRLGEPGRRLVGRMERAATGRMEQIHPVALEAPGEDFLYLLPAWACFLLVTAFPKSDAVWELTEIDDWPDERRDALLRFHRSCVQRHLYAHGLEGRRWLSKNPSFTACVRTIRRVYPDARFVFCFRTPVEALPSQLSSLRPAADLMGWSAADPEVVERFADMYARFAAIGAAGDAPERERARFVHVRQLGAGLRETVADLYDGFGWSVGPAFSAALEHRAERAARHRSRHAYDVEEFGLNATDLEQRMGDTMAVLLERSRTGVST